MNWLNTVSKVVLYKMDTLLYKGKLEKGDYELSTWNKESSHLVTKNLFYLILNFIRKMWFQRRRGRISYSDTHHSGKKSSLLISRKCGPIGIREKDSIFSLA